MFYFCILINFATIGISDLVLLLAVALQMRHKIDLASYGILCRMF